MRDKLKAKNHLSYMASLREDAQPNEIYKQKSMANLIASLTYGNVFKRNKNKLNITFKSFSDLEKQLLIELAIFDTADIEIYPRELFTERYGKRISLDEDVTRNMAKIVDYVRMDENGLSLRNAIIEKYILISNKKELGDRIIDILRYVSRYVSERRNDIWYIIFQCLLKEDIRDRLYNDLNKLIRALEIYLTDYVEKEECNCVLPDIQEIVKENVKGADGEEQIKYCKVLSFNYTNTYERLYLDKQQIQNSIDYIHGKAKLFNTVENNNMVLGIDEYLTDERKDRETEFIAFKKFYQRIYKETGCKYKDWVETIREEYDDFLQEKERIINRANEYVGNDVQRMMHRLQASAVRDQKCKMHNVYIFGHSLDITDKDILRELILNENVYTTIFYLNRDVMGQQIANLVKIIGQDELIRRTGGKSKTIEFKQQKEC